jgi:N-acetylglutamate synthase/N-acetylornithine aminotransferase
VPILGLSGLRKAELASSASLVKQAAKAADPELARIIVLAAAGSAAAAEALRMVSYARG